MEKHPNVVYVFSDQHRAEATGYNGNQDVKTPHLDALAKESISLNTAVANIPCCSPYRATFLTGRYPLTHGVFVNDVHLSHEAVSIADAFKNAGYDTAYIGKWHVNGRGRSNYIPREDRQGFDYWKALECTHNYNHSHYYGDDDVKLVWDGYDAEAQTRDAQNYIRGRQANDKPFFLVLSWGPPHNPYETAPQRFKAMYDPDKLTLRPNVPTEARQNARSDLAGYYAHISAIDQYVGDVLDTLRESGLDEDTIFIYTSDHGDMIYSQGTVRKQRPWDESIRVPFLLRFPSVFSGQGRQIDEPFNSPDIMPTLLGLSGVTIPSTVEGNNYAPYLRGDEPCPADAALIASVHPFGEYARAVGGREYRGIRTKRYTYVRDLNGPWLLYDNESDPYQFHNLCGAPKAAYVQAELEKLLMQMLKERNDEFLPGEHYIDLWGYVTDERGTVPYTP